MKKNELKQLIKPLVKECIHEVLIEEGLLANVVAEVTKGMQDALLTEACLWMAGTTVRNLEMCRKT